MANMIPLIKSGGFYASRYWTPLVIGNGLTTTGGDTPDPPVQKTVSGSIIHITDALAAPAVALSTAINPVQDLHGYDNPWPAGGGKNLFDRSLMSDAESGAKYIDLTLKPNTAYTASSNDPMASGAADIFFVLPGESVSTGTNGVYKNRPVTRTTGADGVARIGYRAYNSLPISTLVGFETQVEEGSTATAFVPYSNICPITGWTGANVTRTGKNLFYGDTSGYMSNIDGSISSAGSNIKAMSVYVPCGDNTKLYYYVEPHTDTQYNYAYRIAFYDSDKKWISNTGMYVFGTTTAVNIPNNAEYIRCSSWETGGRLSIAFENYETYIPYNGTTYPIDWTSEAGTVYGGTLDVLTGVLTVDRVCITPTVRNLQSINAYGIANFGLNITGASTIAADRAKAICTHLKYQTSLIADTTEPGFLMSSDSIAYYRVQSTTASTAEEATSWITTNNVQLCYILATPTTVQLDPATVQLLLGENNIWTDTGDTTLTYLADGRVNSLTALNMLLGNMYTPSADVSDREALQIIMGESE